MISGSLFLKLGILAGWITSAVYIHYRGRERLRFMRQLTDLSTFLAPFNACVYRFSKVKARPFANLELFPELAVFRDNWRIMAEEARTLHSLGFIQDSARREDIAFNTFFRRGWKRFYFKWYHRMLPSAEELCPRSAELVRSVPSVRAAMFVLLPAHSELGLHRDPFAGSLRYHLGLITPNSEACRIYVDGEPHAWRDGEDVLFDETLVHRARNDTDQDRILFFADVARPIINRPVAAAVEFVSTHIAKLTSARNFETERLGAINRLAGVVNHAKTFFTKAKEFNPWLYYACKYALTLYLVYLLFAPEDGAYG